MTICPGCNRKISLHNNGCPYCGYEYIGGASNEEYPFRIPSLVALTRSTMPFDDVSPAFLRRLILAKQPQRPQRKRR